MILLLLFGVCFFAVKLMMNFFKIGIGDMSVNLGGIDTGVAE